MCEKVCSFYLCANHYQGSTKTFNASLHGLWIIYLLFFSHSTLMAPRKKKTHLSQGKKYGGSPRELPDDDLPTYADVARCFYTICKKNHNFKMQVKTVQENVMNVWKKCCSHLPLLLGASVFLKLVRFLTHVKQQDTTQVFHIEVLWVQKGAYLWYCNMPLWFACCDMWYCSLCQCELPGSTHSVPLWC